jgi:predicted O-methyltransferase YrrM
MDHIHQVVVDRFKDRHEVRVHRATSHDAAASFPNGFFDWVYIDGDHSYEAVRQDLSDWSPKVKSGGLVVGDDLNWKDESGAQSVRRAVEEFTKSRSASDALLRRDQFMITV